MENIEYCYYLYKVEKYNSKELESIFEEGIISYKGCSIDSLMVRADEFSLEKLKEINGYEAIYVIKIPKCFMEPLIKNSQIEERPIPIWLPITKKENNDTIVARLPKEYVYGIYLKENDAFCENYNHFYIHDPAGYEFDEAQVKYFFEQKCLSWHKYAKVRSGRSTEYLYNSDVKNEVWKEAKEEYNELFNKEISKKNNL
ncbi:MAG TPA: hypothetical protein GX713_04115 [Mollicutes bacterium]|nr:hypothetical protein [Mollicutes bacterium]